MQMLGDVRKEVRALLLDPVQLGKSKEVLPGRFGAAESCRLFVKTQGPGGRLSFAGPAPRDLRVVFSLLLRC